jgi:diaminobutyrate-2-oxoglutarate transaminase
MSTSAKRTLLETLHEVLLRPRNLDYKILFPGPTGTNAVEAALKLVRKATGRHNVVAFTNGFHGMTLGALALTGNSGKRAGAGVPLQNVTHMPFCDYLGDDGDSLASIERYLGDSSSGLDLPAAFVVETVQAEGGVNVASYAWLRKLADLARRYEILLIVDDIQVGCGRTGPFFSFEPAGIVPDVVCLSKSISGYGLPFALTLLRPELDVFSPGEHNGTFRGHNFAFVSAAAALKTWWRSDSLSEKTKRDGDRVASTLDRFAATYGGEVRGRGMIQGIAFEDATLAQRVSRAAFERGLVIETSGPRDEVLKCLAPLTISERELSLGLEILEDAVATAVSRSPPAAAGVRVVSTSGHEDGKAGAA